MANIPDTEYITVKRNKNGAVGVFVGGKPAIHYRGVNIYDRDYVKDIFAWIQEQNPNITELHVLSSKMWCKFAMVGNPSSKHGRYAWCRVKNNDGELGGWVCDSPYTSASDCASLCANICALKVWEDDTFQRAVLVTAFDNGQNGKMRNPMIWVVLIGHKSWASITLVRMKLLLEKLPKKQNKR